MLWLLQARVPDADKAALLDAPISPGHTFGPAVEILQRSHRECEASRQVAALLAPQTQTVTRTVPVPTAPVGDLRHRLQGTPAANNQAHPAGRGNAGRGQPTHQHHGRRVQCQHPQQPEHNSCSTSALAPQTSGCLPLCKTVTCFSSAWDLLPFEGSQVTLLLCQKLLGLMAAAISAIQLDLFRMCPLQVWLNAFHLNTKHDRD
ncbi:UNVERIFIED_CONTAM: hypothetical protein FKN15_060352 [Acipenser sinensis]